MAAGARAFRGQLGAPGGYLEPGETLEGSIRRHLAAKVDVRELAHLEQLETRSDPGRNPRQWELATAYLGLVPADLDPALPPDTAWHPVGALPPAAFDHGEIVEAGLTRLRAKLSYTNIAFALAPDVFTLSELRALYVAASAATSRPRTSSACCSGVRCSSEPERSASQGERAAGRRSSSASSARELEVTDPFAVLRPPR